MALGAPKVTNSSLDWAKALRSRAMPPSWCHVGHTISIPLKGSCLEPERMGTRVDPAVEAENPVWI